MSIKKIKAWLPGFVLVVGVAAIIGVVVGLIEALKPEAEFTGHIYTFTTPDKTPPVLYQNEADTALGQYAINMMYRSTQGKKLSDGKKQILARAIVRVSNDIFVDPMHKRAFIAVLEIESGFQRFAQSPTGPKGYAQLAKATFHESMANCGVTGLTDEDVWETDLNLYAGACYFRMMLERNDNDPFVAIVAYNQGPSSSSAKTYSKYGSMDNTEALKYLAKFSFLQRNTTDTKIPNIPSIQDLPTPGPSVKTKN